MALTQISTAGVKDDAVTAGKIPANAVGSSEIAANAVGSSELADNAVDNAAVASNAAIAGTKISPDFGSQAVTTTGNASVGETLTVTGNNPNLVFTDSNSNPDFKIYGSNGAFSILDSTNAVNRFVISSSGGVTIGGNTDFGAGIDVTGVTTTTGRVNIGDTQMSSNLLNVEDGTAATIDLASHGSGGDTAYIGVKKSTGGGLTFGISNRDIIFKTGATYSNGTTFDSGTERMRIDSSGRLLLGTTTAGEATADDFTVATSGHTGISIRSGTSGEGNIFFADGTSGDAQYRGMVRYFHNDDALAFNAAGSERMRIDSSGNVGINTTSISNRLEIANSTSDKGILIKSTGNNYHTICGDANRSQATDNILRLDAKWNGTVVGRIRLIAGNDTTNKDDGIIAFDTASGGAMGERMRINSDGRVGIGITSLVAKFSVSENANVVEPIRIDDTNNTDGNRHRISFRTGNSEVGKIVADRSSTTYTTSSDYRLKENEVAISDGITRLKTLKPYRFNFKIKPENIVDGFFAHEVTAVPEAITGTKDEVDSDNNPVYQGIDQSKLVPLLTAALQEAIAKIETLETKVAALEAG